MDEQQAPAAHHHRGGGRAAKRAARSARAGASMPYITRRIGCYEVLDEEGLALIERNADTILAEIGIDYRDDAEALAIWKAAGADVQGERVRCPPGMCRSIVQASAPREFVQHARNPERSVPIGGKHTVFAPAYGSPFIRNLDEGRRYATIEDFRNFVKLAYVAPSLHHSGGTICEPVDLPVNKRHFDMVYSHMKYSDKPFMGSVTHPERAQDTVEMAKILFGDALHRCRDRQAEDGDHQPDQRQLADDLRRDDARGAEGLCAREPGLHRHAVHPRRRDVAGDGRRHRRADAGRGAVGHGVHAAREPRCAGRAGQLRVVDLDAVRRADVRHAGAHAGALRDGRARAAARRAVPLRRRAVRSKIPDAQAAYESANTLLPTCLAGVNFVLHTAGWLEGGLAMGYEKFVMDVDQAGMMHTLCAGVDLSENGQAMDAIREVGPGKHFLGCAHTQANFETAFYRSSIADNNSVEQWEAEGSQDTAAARQRDLEEAARGLRGAAARSRRRRSAAGLREPAQGVVSGFEVLIDRGRFRAPVDRGVLYVTQAPLAG